MFHRLIVVALLATVTPLAWSQDQATVPATSQHAQPLARMDVPALYRQVRPSLVAVQYTWESELGRREVIGAGVVVSEDGKVMTSLALVDQRIPDAQMTQFKILVPSDTSDVEELDATFLGRDERGDVAFVQAKEPRKWQPVRFVDRGVEVGDPVWSVGILPKMAGYKAYIVEGQVSARLRGELPQVLVSGQLASTGSPVFNSAGEAVGFVNAQAEQPILLNEPKTGLTAISRSPVIFIASSALQQSISNSPNGTPLQLPWLGVIQMIGLPKEVAEYFGLKGQTAVQLGDVIPGGPADRAGMKAGQIITAINGSPIMRGDEPEELPMIMRRQVLRMPVGQEVKLTVLDPRTRQSQVITMKLEERPKQQNLAQRFYAEDLGFSVRELVFMDAYSRHLEPGGHGALVSLVKPQGAAQSARLEGNDMVVELNGREVKDLEQFKKDYEQFRKERPKDAVVLVVLREGKNQTIRIEPPQ